MRHNVLDRSEDDYAAANKMRKSMLNYTQMGILTAVNMKDAVSYLSDNKFKIDAIVADLYVESAKMYEEKDLYNG